MKLYEITESASAGSTSSGSIASVPNGLGATITRTGSNMLGGKYSAEATPNTPAELKRYKQNAVGRFKNSIGH